MGVRDEGTIFKGFRALGNVCNHVPLQVRYISRRREHLIATAVGNTFHTYGSNKLGLLTVGSPHSKNISCLAGDVKHVYTASGNIIQAWKNGTELVHTYKGHTKDVILILPFGPHLITIDEESNLKVFECSSEELYLELEFDPKSFQISAIAHPNTYINKILLGSTQGKLQLWNLKSSSIVYTFKGWDSAVMCIEQAPAIDVVGIGLENGCIVIHNLRFDQVIMKLYQDYGPVVSMSFRSDGQPMLATGSPAGHIVLWNLEEKKLWHQLLSAHQSTVSGVKFLHNEPLLVSSSPDNALKMWIFDMPDGQGRLFKLREGHSAPPTRVRFYDPLGDVIISAGQDSTLKSFSTVMDLLNKNLGQASNNRKDVKKHGLKGSSKLRPIVNFSFELTEEKRFDNIIAIHRNTLRVTTWSFDKKKMGDHKFVHPRFQDLKTYSPKALCSEISSCGNFVFIGYSTGHVDKYNIQSGILRGTFAVSDFPNYKIMDLKTDLLNTVLVTGDSLGVLRFWSLKKPIVLKELELEDSISQMFLHRESDLLAVSMDNFHIVVIDIKQMGIARIFSGHSNVITDLTFSPDSRWLVSASMDRTITVWDLPSGRCIDKMRVGAPCTSLSFSPNGEYLATTHVDDKGIYLWVNKSVYDYVPICPISDDAPPIDVCLPGVLVISEGDNEQVHDVGEDEYASPQQLADHLVTLSLLPESHWKNLLYLDTIRTHNKPKEPPKIPKRAPFFLPVLSGLQPQLDVSVDSSENLTSGDLPLLLADTNLNNLLRNGDINKTLEYLTSLGPAKIDMEIRSLGPESGGSIESMKSFLCFLHKLLQTNKYFELLQAWLGLFLKIHSETVYGSIDLLDPLQKVQSLQGEMWNKLIDYFNDCSSIVNYIQNIKVL